MTREEAIECLEYQNDMSFGGQSESLKMAIEALKQELCDDVINRQTVKEQMIKYGFLAPDMTVTEFVEDLPSVNPQESKCGDLISRQAVINAIANTCFWLSSDNWEELIKCINSISPIKSQEPKEGCWIEVIDEIDSLENKTWHYECSICRSGNSGWGNYKYCPNCGAKMVEPQERSDKK